MNRRVLVTGGDGQLGRTMADLGRGAGVVGVGRAGLDLTDSDSIAASLDRWRPAVVVNAAAYTDVDAAESDEATADEINHLGAARLARACADRGIDLVQVSTDYVFDGTVPPAAARSGAADPGPADTAGPVDPARAPALEPDDPVGPATAYGRTKLAGERAVLGAHPAATVVRTSWVYSGPDRTTHRLGGSDFVHTMMRLEAERELLQVVDDQWGSPTCARTLAIGLVQLAHGITDGRVDARGRIVHLAGSGRTTWCGLAREVFRGLGADPQRVHACTTEEYPRPAPRPAFSVLSTRSWTDLGLDGPAPWEEDLRAVLSGLRRRPGAPVDHAD